MGRKKLWPVEGRTLSGKRGWGLPGKQALGKLGEGGRGTRSVIDVLDMYPVCVIR